MNWLSDQILILLQQRCQHPDKMMATDILEGCGNGIEVKYCRRCGGIGVRFPNQLAHEWRLPNPNLWRGK